MAFITGNGTISGFLEQLYSNDTGNSTSIGSTGIILGLRIDTLSGYSNSTFATLLTSNSISGNLIQSGLALYVLTTGLSGQIFTNYGTPGTIVYQSGDQIISGVKTFVNTGIFAKTTGRNSLPVNTVIFAQGADGNPARVVIDTYNSANSFGSSIRFRRGRGTSDNPSGVFFDDVLAQIVSDGHNGTQFYSSLGSLALHADSDFSIGSSPTYFTIRTTPTLTTSSIERFRIGSSGQVFIGNFTGGALSGTNLLTVGDASGVVKMTVDNTGVNITSGNFYRVNNVPIYNPSFYISEVNLGTGFNAGNFYISGLAGLNPGYDVPIRQAVGPYTFKGSLADEAEMDFIGVSAYAINSTTIQVFWNANPGPVQGNFKFSYNF